MAFLKRNDWLVCFSTIWSLNLDHMVEYICSSAMDMNKNARRIIVSSGGRFIDK